MVCEKMLHSESRTFQSTSLLLHELTSNAIGFHCLLCVHCSLTGSDALIVGVVVGVLLAVLVIVLVASIVTGLIIRDKFSRNQPRKKNSAVPSVTGVPSEDVPPSNLIPG